MAPVTEASPAYRRTWGDPRRTNCVIHRRRRVLSQQRANRYRLMFRAGTPRARIARAGLAVEVSCDSREGPEG